MIILIDTLCLPYSPPLDEGSDPGAVPLVDGQVTLHLVLSVGR